MAHHIYQTEAIILHSREVGEANRHYALFTRELGLINASAQSVRSSLSKLRGNLQEYSKAHIALVRGKGGWKITSAIALRPYLVAIASHPTYQSKKGVVAHAAKLVARLVVGEEKNDQLYTLFTHALDFMAEHTDLSEREVQNAECILVLSLLHELGYVGHKEEYIPFVRAEQWSRGLLAEMEGVRASAFMAINTGIRESQL